MQQSVVSMNHEGEPEDTFLLTGCFKVVDIYSAQQPAFHIMWVTGLILAYHCILSCTEVAVCTWQDVEIQLLSNCTFVF